MLVTFLPETMPTPGILHKPPNQALATQVRPRNLHYLLYVIKETHFFPSLNCSLTTPVLTSLPLLSRRHQGSLDFHSCYKESGYTLGYAVVKVTYF